MLKRLPRTMIAAVRSVAIIGAAVLLTFAIRPIFGGKTPLLFFTIGVVLSAAYDGFWAGVLTTLLGALMAGWLFEQSIFLLAMSQSSLILFAVLGVIISVVIHLLHRANAQVIAAREQLELANKQLLQRTEAVSRSNEELQRFAYAISHDLQAPLGNIASLTALLVRRNRAILDEDSQECARMIIHGVDRMKSMIRGLLDFAAATAEMPHRPGRADCNSVVAQVLRDLQYLIEAEGALISTDPLPTVAIQEDRLAQVFSNLIANAIKYRSERTPEIHIAATENAGEWLFRVRDNGIGIDMKYADEIFGLFKRLDGSGEHEGNGIGLAICKAVIERLGGTIGVESEPGKGSTFFFTIPKTAGAYQAAAVEVSNATSDVAS